MSDEYARRLGHLFAHRQPPLAEPKDAPGPPGSFCMKPLVAYRSSWDRGWWIMASYIDPSEEQLAFNEVFAALPPEWQERDMIWRLEWMLLPPKEGTLSPGRGYIGVKWERTLASGEYIARGRIRYGDAPGVILYEDVVVTDTTLPELRASGKYDSISTPRPLLKCCVHAGEPRCGEETVSINPRENDGNPMRCVTCGALIGKD